MITYFLPSLHIPSMVRCLILVWNIVYVHSYSHVYVQQWVLLYHGMQRRMVLVDNFFRIFQIIIFCFVADICDLVHDVEAIHGQC